MNNGTLTEAPVSTVASFIAFVAVLPFSPGSVYVTSKTVLIGNSAKRTVSVDGSGVYTIVLECGVTNAKFVGKLQ